MKVRQALSVCAAVALVLGLAWMTASFTRGSGRTSPRQPQDPTGGGFPELLDGLREVEGCLGVELAQTSSGKSVIFGWFESKEACARWYWSEMHQGAARAFFPDRDRGDYEPMKDVPDNVGPVLAIASITVSDQHELDEVAMPIKQIAIELYTPIKGGLAIGGSFAPEHMVVPARKVIAVEDE